MKKYLTPDEINARLASTRNQKFRRLSQNRIDGLARMSAENKYKATTEEGKEKIKKRNQHANYKKRDFSWMSTEEGRQIVKQRGKKWKANKQSHIAKQKESFQLNLDNNLDSIRKGVEKRESNTAYKKQRAKRILDEKGIKCQVKPPDSEWKTFDSFSTAAKFYDWSDLSGTPKTYFPEDGSVKTGIKGKRKGWKSKRL